ncbi:MAG TPA: methylenetetrahydrofolate reductase C-terminal domain-containing protein [Bryobacteraceae bacterium]|nr:methylenetetrahydrofolate reductase C-terminal domain-containing protein [Bryobacteraceae bacterium]
MASANPIRDAITSGRFCYMVEMVASASMTEERLGEIAAGIAPIPGVVGAGITSWAGGSAGHDPVRVAALAKERGLTPNVHLTCVSKTPADVAKFLDELIGLGIENTFAITGDYPKGAPLGSVGFACDSVQLAETIAEQRASGKWPFFISVAVSPFKYLEEDCAYQYLKLEKKIAAGADFAITQLGFDSRKYREMKRYLDERGLAKFPVLGNVYVLPPKAAERMSKGDPPGCWVSPELLARIQEEAKAPDKGLAARLERAAQMAAIVRGLGYAGAYIGGTHEPDRIRWIIQRADELAPRWEELAEEISYGDKSGFFMYEGAKPAPKKRDWTQPIFDMLEPANWPGFVRKPLTGILGWVDHHPSLAKAMEDAEFAFKKPVFGCQACGNCVLGLMEYVCPMTCPKNMRNGPCGGTFNGQCEVIPEQKCIWVAVYDRAEAAHRVDDLKEYIPPRNRALEGTSSYINYLLNKDSRPEHPIPLISINNLQPPARESEESLAKK